MRKVLSAGAVLAVVGLLLAAVASGSADKASQSSTLVFGASAEPTSLDPPFIFDGESLRSSYQIYENLIAQVPGTTRLAPKLATAWKASNRAKTWTFTLRRGVTFQDVRPSTRGQSVQLRPLVQLQGRAGELVLLVLLQRAVRRVKNQGQGEGAVQELSGAR